MSDAMEPNDGMNDDRNETENGVIELDPRLAAALRDVGPIDPTVRAAAVTAALGAVAPAEVTSLNAERRRRRVRVMSSLSAAAAAIMLVAVGISVAPSSGGDDAAETSSAAIDAQAAAEAPTADMRMEIESAPAEEAASEPALEYASAGEAVLAEADTAETAVTAYGVDDELPMLANKAELVDQTDAFAAMVANGSAETPDSECLMIGGGAVGRAVFDDIEVVLFRDLASGTYTALAVDDCRTIVQVVVEP